MIKFTSIEAYRNTVKYFNKYGHHYKGKTAFEYVGCEKLHGTNAGVVIKSDGTLIAQSRERELAIDDDNAGFCAWVLRNSEKLKEAFSIQIKKIPNGINTDNVFFGEWIGKGINKGVGINAFEKHFVLFSLKTQALQNTDILSHEENDGWKYIPIDPEIKDHSIGLYNINEISSYPLTIDFSQPEKVIPELERLTLAIEDNSPWANYVAGLKGVTLDNTIGEGLVWIPEGYSHISDLWFKTKGMKHKNDNVVHKIEVSPQVSASIKECVDKILPLWRLEQGISYFKENNIDIDPKNTGEYLKWISKDIIKEETDIISASGFDWKELVKEVTTRARVYFFKEIGNEI